MRIMALDIGAKRTGIAVTDSLQLIASALDTVETAQLLDYLKKYTASEPVETIVLGEAKQMDYTESESMNLVRSWEQKLKTAFPAIQIAWQDERFTSKMAMQTLHQLGAGKKVKRDKAQLDKIAATLILQAYLERKG